MIDNDMIFTGEMDKQSVFPFYKKDEKDNEGEEQSKEPTKDSEEIYSK